MTLCAPSETNTNPHKRILLLKYVLYDMMCVSVWIIRENNF